ncbi:terminase large subunit domain-containing protein [Demequina sp. NBRC 110055]|uniref:terminase large subunit domain-containing protein n=1 Tax=Demequina sp. NBRC 110055 TaxID=1570344 RepID=UPI000A054DBA|nr:terminase large subunit [Demequina sp. NBRC 110055]
MPKATDPTRATRPLSTDFPSAFDPYARAFAIAWRAASGYCLDPWQVGLLRAILEIDPATGNLRHRVALVSVGRQNGKSEIAAALGLWGLLREPGALVIGIASSAEQAGIVYRRAQQIINRNPALARQFAALTETRGIRHKSGARWELKAAKSAALQGLPISVGIVDEVHLLRPALFSDLQNGTGGRKNAIVVGITTAGDDDSELLTDLYRLASEDKIGHWIWEAPAAEIPDDDDRLAEYLRAANPAIACGRIDVATVIQDVRAQSPGSAIRYRLNRFTATDSTWLPLTTWLPLAGEITPPKTGVTFALDRTPTWSHASIVAAWKSGDSLETQVVASVASPTLEKLREVCLQLSARHANAVWVADSYSLGTLMTELKGRGMNARRGTLGDLTSAASRTYALAMQGKLRHAGDPLMAAQLPRVSTKNVGENYRLTRATKAAEIDTVTATTLAIYFAEQDLGIGPQLFV